MKKIIFILVALFSFIFSSCDKSTYTPEQNTVEVSFRFNIISGNILTKGFTDEILENLNYKFPETLYLSSSTNTYTLDLKNNSSFSIQPGSYFISSLKASSTSSNHSTDFISEADNTVQLIVKIDSFKQFMATSTIEAGYFIEITESGTFDVDVIIPSIIIASQKSSSISLAWKTECQSYNDKNQYSTDNYLYYILRVPQAIIFGQGQTYERLTVRVFGNELYEGKIESIDIFRNCFGKYYIFENTNLKNQKSPNMILSNSWTPGN